MFRIGYAANGPDGWERYGETVHPDGSDAWDGDHTRAPSMMVGPAGEHVMAYEGWSLAGEVSIGLARAWARRLHTEPENLLFFTDEATSAKPGFVRLHNEGLLPMEILSVSLAGPGFSLTAPEPGKLPPDDEIAAEIQFTAEGNGTFRAVTVVESLDPERPIQQVQLLGRRGQGQPCDELGLGFGTPSDLFRPGDLFYLDLQVCNPGPGQLLDRKLVILLELGGEYWSAPSWNQGLKMIDAYSLDLPVGAWHLEVIQPIRWPERIPSGAATIWGALLGPSGIELQGPVARWDFRWM